MSEVPAGRDLDWSGSFNVRDLGGLPTADGRTTRWRSIVRSESPDGLTAAGWADLRGHGVRTCVDLRSAFEVGEDPYVPTVAGVERVASPLEEGLLDDAEFAGWAASGLLGTALYYERYLERWSDRVADALRAIATAPPGGVLYHCQRGRDRTGLVTILLLGLVGVPHDAIVEDHLRSDARLVERGVALGHVGLDGEDALYAERATTAEETLRALLGRDLTSVLGDAGLTEDDIAALRTRLLQA